MSLPILTSVVILCLVIAFATHRGKEAASEQENAFWEKERDANNTRRKSLDNLDYISIPLDTLPLTLYTEDNTIAECIATIVELSKSPIVNLTGISNTDLKLQYGAPNIDLLSVYDGRYTTLARTLQTWSKRLVDLGDETAAKTVLEFAISTGTDVSGTYKLLANIYSKEENLDGINNLISAAEKINSPMKASILNALNELK